jgi:hypothetical protein
LLSASASRSTAGNHFEAACHTTIADDGSAKVEPLGIDFTAAELSSGAVQQIDDAIVELVDLLEPPAETVADAPTAAEVDGQSMTSKPTARPSARRRRDMTSCGCPTAFARSCSSRCPVCRQYPIGRRLDVDN